jgi:hypothetical protein
MAPGCSDVRVLTIQQRPPLPYSMAVDACHHSAVGLHDHGTACCPMGDVWYSWCALRPLGHETCVQYWADLFREGNLCGMWVCTYRHVGLQLVLNCNGGKAWFCRWQGLRSAGYT